MNCSVKPMHLVGQVAGDCHGEQDSENSGAGLEEDTDWGQVETLVAGRAREEVRLQGDTNKGEGDGQDRGQQDSIQAELCSELGADERLVETEEAMELEEDEGQEVVEPGVQTKGLVKTELVGMVQNSLYE